MELQDVTLETCARWESGNFLEQGVDLAPYSDLKLPWIPYEDYMEAQLEDVSPGRAGHLRIRFPPETAEDQRMHTHPDSDRIVTILKGSGEFRALRNGQEITRQLKPGDRLWMPRGVVHNFFAGPNGLVVHSLHCPWIPFEDPRCFVRQG